MKGKEVCLTLLHLGPWQLRYKEKAGQFNSIGWVKSVQPLNRTHFNHEIEWAGWTFTAGWEVRRYSTSMVLHVQQHKKTNKQKKLKNDDKTILNS